MRANWDPADQSSVHAAQQQMIYQHNLAILEAAQEQSVYEPRATNNMNISHQLVKNEPVDDNNTGATPENYKTTSCSPGSRHSSATGTPSPELSNDLCMMTPNHSDYVQREIMEHQRRRLAKMFAHQPMDLGTQNNHENVKANYGSPAVTNRYPNAGAPGYFSTPFDLYNYGNGAQMFQQLSLQLSPNSGYQSSLQLSPELNSKLSPNDQNNSELQADKSGDLKHDDDDDNPDKSVKNKKKRKTKEKTPKHKCKDCDFVASSKNDYWKHIETHMKPGRTLKCPKCPFVTEYNHYLIFHTRNHYGNKPFKCEQCEYRCVNKSMLRSHEKLHLEVVQYKCADCEFGTKYSHMLKKHLKAFHHKAQIILNPDGTPNPYAIIDTYGKRRGPKQKTIEKKTSNGTNNKQNNKKNSQKQIDNNENSSSSSIESTTTATIPSPSTSSLTTPAITTTTPITQVSPTIKNSLTTTPKMSPAEYAANQLAIFNNAFQMNPLLTLNHYMNNAFQRDNNFITNEEYADKPIESLQNNSLCEFAENNKNNNSTSIEKINDYNNHANEDDHNNNLNKLNEFKVSAPLDLSKLESSKIDNTLNGKIESSQKHIDEICNTNEDKLDNGIVMQQNKPSGTRKRKGKAVKLVVKKVIEEEFNNDNNGMPNKTPKLSTEISVPDNNDIKKNINITDNNISNESTKKKFTCNYCEISFVKEVMYSLHMGFHGFNDPFHCNSCGKKYEDDVSFFLHICRSEHA